MFVSLFQVNNTDAEGRLTLADALVYTCKQGAEKVVECWLLYCWGCSVAGVAVLLIAVFLNYWLLVVLLVAVCQCY
ncbi:Leucine aminopeptidase 2, chloroplastic-like protein [Drosera capensis]